MRAYPRIRDDESGFTLVEMLIVVLVIAILIAITIPTFLASRRRAQDTAAQSLVRTALSAEIVHYGSAVAYSEDNGAGGTLDGIEPDLAWGSVDATVRGVTASLPAGETQVVILRSRSRAGTTFCIGRVERGANAGTYFTTECDGTETAAVVAGWPTSVDTGW